ncbi:MAG: hypothetical protein ACFNVQ_09040, partial [Campylobacter sp.]
RGAPRISDLIFSLLQEVKTNKALAVAKMLRKAMHLGGMLRCTKDLRAVLARLETAPHQYDKCRLGLSVILSRFEIAGAHR